MSKNASYTITTVSQNLNQISRPVFSQAINNCISLRDKSAPYTVTVTKDDDSGDEILKFPLGRS